VDRRYAGKRLWFETADKPSIGVMLVEIRNKGGQGGTSKEVTHGCEVVGGSKRDTFRGPACGDE